jgi:hypothetical protein
MTLRFIADDPQSLAAKKRIVARCEEGWRECPNCALVQKCPSENRPPLHFILLFEGLKWWAHQGSNLGPDD